MLPIWLAALGTGLANQEQEAKARREATSRIAGQFAGQMGAPQYGLEAAQTQYGIANQPGVDYLNLFLKQKYGQGLPGTGGG